MEERDQIDALSYYCRWRYPPHPLAAVDTATQSDGQVAPFQFSCTSYASSSSLMLIVIIIKNLMAFARDARLIIDYSITRFESGVRRQWGRSFDFHPVLFRTHVHWRHGVEGRAAESLVLRLLANRRRMADPLLTEMGWERA